MRILSFSSCFPSGIDPVTGVFVLRRLAALAQHVSLEVVHPVPWFPLLRGGKREAPRGSEQIGGLTVYHPRFFYFPRILKGTDAWFYARGLRPWLAEYMRRGGRPDLFDAHFEWPDAVGVAQLALWAKVPLVITLRGKINSRSKDPRMRPRIAWSLREANAVISVSTPMAKLAVAMGADPAKVCVIPNGIETSIFKPIPREEARERLSLPKDVRLLVTVADLNPAKGHEETIEALRLLPQDVRLILVGGSSDGGVHRRRLANLVNKGALAGRVTFAGRCAPETVAAYLNAADLSVLASHAEGCPNAVMEALACGTPVVATHVGGIPELIEPQINGVLVAPRDPDALAEGIRTALSHSWSREVVRQTVEKRSWEAVAAEVLAVFQRVLANQDVRPPATADSNLVRPSERGE